MTSTTGKGSLAVRSAESAAQPCKQSPTINQTVTKVNEIDGHPNSLRGNSLNSCFAQNSNFSKIRSEDTSSSHPKMSPELAKHQMRFNRLLEHQSKVNKILEMLSSIDIDNLEMPTQLDSGGAFTGKRLSENTAREI